METKYKDYLTKLQKSRDEISEAEKVEFQRNISHLSISTQRNDSKLSDLKLKHTKLESDNEEFLKKRDEFLKKEKHRPWNIDSICKEGKTKTVIHDSSDNATGH